PRQFVISPDAPSPATLSIPAEQRPRESAPIPQPVQDLPPDGGKQEDTRGVAATGAKSDTASAPLLAPDTVPTSPNATSALENHGTDLSQTLRGSEVPLQAEPTPGPGITDVPVARPESVAATPSEANTTKASGEAAESAVPVNGSAKLESNV